MIKPLTGTTLRIFLLGSMLIAQDTTQSRPSDQGVKSDVSEAGHATGRAAKKTARKTKHETKKGTHKAVKKTRQGAQKVADKTQTPPQ
jgi:hypothetical protein